MVFGWRGDDVPGAQVAYRSGDGRVACSVRPLVKNTGRVGVQDLATDLRVA